MEGEEILDWELVHGSDADSITSEMESSVIDDGMIVSDHFSADQRTTEQSTGSGDSSRRLRVGASESGGFGFRSVGCDLQVESQVCLEEHVEDASKCLSETEHLQVDNQAGVGVEEHIDSSAIERFITKPLALIKRSSFGLSQGLTNEETRASVAVLLNSKDETFELGGEVEVTEVDQYLNIKLENTRVVDQNKFLHMSKIKNLALQYNVNLVL
ncbi:hypothetical protein Bca52824_075431 [Brassica carinata]|uniref:Uncharacterized protein n=1 Tax=Brassica carinata TaxID=52824 RepID=A0A8X7PSW9_BRACI|nr:hypothetical protein Bca52824_075431 [Brassica carinata]